tara:strand:- start:866 stop:1786 length:921 start_codon:yes stop_codon:yes gene_type:complete
MGQDGSLLCKSLLKKGTNVIGIAKDSRNDRNHLKIGIQGEIQIFQNDVCDFRSIEKIILQFTPTHIFNLAGQSSVGKSFQEPFITYKSIVEGTLNLLEICKRNQYPGKLFFAGSSEIFGETNTAADIEHSTKPVSPYGQAKETSFNLVKMYRELYALQCVTGILFNHESNLRSQQFVTQKIIQGAIETHKNKTHKISLGNLKIARDWGCAEEYVEAMQYILNSNKIKDQIICTGELTTLEKFTEIAYKHFDLNWKDHVEKNPQIMRAAEIMKSYGNPSGIYQDHGWKAKIKIKSLIKKLILNHLPE